MVAAPRNDGGHEMSVSLGENGMQRKKSTEKSSGTGPRYTRSEAARVLGVGRSTVVRMEKAGELRAKVDGGVHSFDPAEVAELARRRRNVATMKPGELAALVFQQFEDGKELSDIVRELQIEPATVRRLYLEFKTDLEEGFIRATDKH